jgi:hypothetical protein
MKKNRTPLRAIVVFVAWGLMGGSSVRAVEIGDTRNEVITENGAPSGAITVGSREILTYPHGRIILENGMVTRFEAIAPATSYVPAGEVAMGAGGTVANRPSPTPQRWLSTVREAKAEAAVQNKPILFFVTGNLDRLPWGKQFQQTIQTGTVFIRRMAADYTLLRLDVSSVQKLAEDATLEEIRQREYDLKEIKALREEVFETDAVPALAVLNADGTQATVVNMDEVQTATDMLGYTQKAIRTARDQPRKMIAVYKPGMTAEGKRMIAYLAAGIVSLVWIVKRIKS